MKKNLLFIIIIIIFSSCGVFNKGKKENPVSQAHDSIQNDTIAYLSLENKKLLDTIRIYQVKYDSLQKEKDLLKLDNDTVFYVYEQNGILRSANKNLKDSIILLKTEIKQLQKEIKDNKKPQKVVNNKKVDFNNSKTWAETIKFRGAYFDVYVTDIDANNIDFYLNDKNNNKYNSLGRLNKDLKKQKKKLLFATNGGMYTPESEPNGLYVEKGKTITKLNTRSEHGNFYMNFGEEPNSNGVFIIDKNNKARVCKTSEYQKYKKTAYNATQSGPLLLYNGKINPKFNDGSKNLRLRSGVGVINDTKIVFIISKKPVNFYDFAKLFKDTFKCSNALFLDGVISQMYLPEIKRNDTGGEFGVIIGITKK